MKLSRSWFQVSVREAMLVIACFGVLCAWYREHSRCDRLLYLCGSYRACMERAEEGGQGGHYHNWLCNGSMVYFSVEVKPFDKTHFPDCPDAR